MNIIRIVFCAAIIAVPNFPVYAQAPGDLNCNGFLDVDDIVRAISLVTHCEIGQSECSRRNGDADGDGRPVTIGDMTIFPYFLIAGYGNFPPGFSRHPESDTILIESITASPGDSVSLPVWISTIDTLIALQFWIEVDSRYVEFDTMIVYNNPTLNQSDCGGNVYFYSSFGGYEDPIILLPGYYLVAEIIVNIKLENDHPITTYLSFSSDPQQALYSGFANYHFFQPVMVNGSIQIIP